MTDYKAVYKNTGTTPRTFDEAYNTPDYATGLWRCETDNNKGIKLLISWAVVGGLIAWLFLSVYAVYKLFLG